MKLKLIKFFSGKASKQEKIQLALAFFGSSTAIATAVGLFFLGIVMILAIGMSSSSSTERSTSSTNLPEMVTQWREKVTEEAEKNGIPEAVNYILALIQVESGGNAITTPDIMQASESQGRAPNSISDPYESIEVGVRYFATMYKSHKDMDILNVVQAYNYGGGYLSYAEKNYDLERAISFSRDRAGGKQMIYTNPVAAEHGYNYRYAYGNMFYALVVKQYVNSEESETDNDDDSDNDYEGNSDVVNIAQQEVNEGTHEGGQKYWSWYGYGGRVEWCAVFVSWVAAKANINMEKFAYCPTGIQNFKQKNQWQSVGVEPKDGWIVFFDWNGDGVSDHVGIVKHFSNGTVYTLEGNSEDMTRERNYTQNSQYILGYGTPN